MAERDKRKAEEIAKGPVSKQITQRRKKVKSRLDEIMASMETPDRREK